MKYEGLLECKGKKAATLMNQFVRKIQSRQISEFKISLGYSKFRPRCGRNGSSGTGPTHLVYALYLKEAGRSLKSFVMLKENVCFPFPKNKRAGVKGS